MIDNIINEVKNKICKLLPKIDAESIDCNKNFMMYGMTSIDYIQLIVYLEEKYEIEFEEDFLEIESLNNVQRLAEYIYKQISN